MKRLFVCICLVMLSCGEDLTEGTNSRGSDDSTRPLILRGQWKAPLGQGEVGELYLSKTRSFDTEIEASVRARVRFLVNSDSLQNPEDPEDGIISFGELKIENLRDNKLKVCGENGRTICEEALFRIYTQGTPESGLWNEDAGYGLPLSTGDSPIGLGSEGAHVLATRYQSYSRRLFQCLKPSH